MDPLTSIDRSEPPKPPPSPRPPRHRPLPWRARLAAGFAVLVTLAFLGWTLLRLFPPASSGEPQEALPTLAEAPRGLLIVDATPWGEVRRIVGPGGLPLPLPTDAATPLVLELPAGRYRIDLEGPPESQPQSCEVDVATGSPAHCRPAFSELEAADYFREAGWWQ